MKRNLRKRTVDEDEDAGGDGGGAGKPRADEEAQALNALREVQRLRGTKAFRDAQREAKRRREEQSKGSEAQEQAAAAEAAALPYGLTVRKKDEQRATQDITDHTKRMFVIQPSKPQTQTTTTTPNKK